MAADVYALGMTIYETVTGDIPYADKTDTAVLVEVLVHRRLPSWNASAVRVEGGKDQLWQLMCDCWNREAALRPTASEIEIRLDPAAKQPNLRSEERIERVEFNNFDQPSNTQPLARPQLQVPKTEVDRPQLSTISQPQTPSVSGFSSLSMGGEIRRKLVIVGDAPCGKTCLLLVFSKGTFPEYSPGTVFENYVADVEIDGKHVELSLWDTAGMDGYERLRPLSYPDSHVILVCFSINSRDSFDNIPEKWDPEVKHFCPGIPFILVGCKKDLRHDPKTIEELRGWGQHPVTFMEGMGTAQKIGALHYLECSAKTGEGIKQAQEV
ncbi:GTP-binding protein Rho1 [Ceratobasidium sp. 395]|nr:GTP-binding protein Rho1 [Ceratobasidium sp. 395]